MKFPKLSMFLFLGASIAGATTLTVSPGGAYPTVCSAVSAAQHGDTILIDANHGIPYIAPPDPHHTDGRTDCVVNQNYLTIRGIKGRAILDAGPDAYARGVCAVGNPGSERARHCGRQPGTRNPERW